MADEIANDTGKIVLERWDRLRGEDVAKPGPPRAYLFKTATHLWHRRGPRETIWASGLVDPHDPGAEAASGSVLASLDLSEVLADRQAAHGVVHRTLNLLDIPKRQVLWLRHAEEFDTRETAAILRIPSGTVKTRLAAAVHQFKDIVLASGALQETGWGLTR
ncbi:sigma factor-like helix-turn-helix DNA-binding protein [Nonomuraea sp. NPDC048916]|uniref:RNA polymerase sigma factor n=1 Tax=Nonomuraea sp. NPDC048916 TaxID=3154232 RepID=UPI0033FC5358